MQLLTLYLTILFCVFKLYPQSEMSRFSSLFLSLYVNCLLTVQPFLPHLNCVRKAEKACQFNSSWALKMTDVLLINTACEKSSSNPRWAGQAGERSTTPKIYPAHARHCPLLSNHLKLDSHEDGMSWTCSLGCGYLSCQWMMGITQYGPTCRYYLLQWWAHLDHPFTAWFIPAEQIKGTG